MTAVLTLLLAHLIADFPLQTEWIYQFKCRSSLGVALHAMIHAATVAVFLQNPLRDWPVWLSIFGVHFLIDWLKLHIPTKRLAAGFLCDQAAHLTSLILVVLLIPGMGIANISHSMLYLALSAALIPAVSMFLWVYTLDLGGDSAQCQRALVLWGQRQMKSISKQSGLVFLCLLVGFMIVV